MSEENDRLVSVGARVTELHGEHKSLAKKVDQVRTEDLPEIKAALARIETKLDERTSADGFARTVSLIAGALAGWAQFGGHK